MKKETVVKKKINPELTEAPPQILHGAQPITEMEVDLAASAKADFLHFDVIPCFGVNQGQVHMTLEAFRYLMIGANDLKTNRVVVANLRFGAQGLAALKEVVDQLVLMTANSASEARN